jgi:hypothetical protein
MNRLRFCFARVTNLTAHVNTSLFVADPRLANLSDPLLDGSLSETTGSVVILYARVGADDTLAGSIYSGRRASHHRALAPADRASKLSLERLWHLILEARTRDPLGASLLFPVLQLFQTRHFFQFK